MLDEEIAVIIALIGYVQLTMANTTTQIVLLLRQRDLIINILLTLAGLDGPQPRVHRIPRHTDFVETIVPRFNDKFFKQNFRMRRSTFDIILEKLRPSLSRRKPGCRMIPAEKQLLIAIWRMTTPDCYRSICMKFGVSHDAALSSVRRVTKALGDVAYQYITWPEADQIAEISAAFEATSGFPNVLGSIDGTHINITAPKENHEAYIDRKGHHSIQLQAVCDNRCKFIDCYAGQVGSVHDARVFRLSELNEDLFNDNKFPNGCHIVGDAAYKLDEHLLTPFRNNGHLTPMQNNYNYCHSSARITIERAFGLLKCRFRSLLTVLDMHRTDLIPRYIVACCVLHNICIMNNDELDIDPDYHADDDDEPVHDGGRGHNRVRHDAAVAKRFAIMRQLPQRYA